MGSVRLAELATKFTVYTLIYRTMKYNRFSIKGAMCDGTKFVIGSSQIIFAEQKTIFKMFV